MKEMTGKTCCGGHSHDHHSAGQHCCQHEQAPQGETCAEGAPAGHQHSGSCCHTHQEDDGEEDDDGGIHCSCCSSKPQKGNQAFITTIAMSISAIGLVLAYFGISVYGVSLAWLPILLCGLPIAKEAIESLFDGFHITTDLLITVALIAACSIGELFAAAEVAFIMAIGEMLESYTLRKANKGLEKLLSYAPTTAHLLKEDRDVLAQEVEVNHVVLVKPGETVPVDGVVIYGQSQIDQSAMTGESMPVEVGLEDVVYGGTINGDGVLHVRATKVGKDSTISKMIALVKRAQSQKAGSVRIADKLAGYIVPASILTSLAVLLVTRDLVRAVTILVVFCPCALVLATPTAIMAGIGRATRTGILIKSGEAMEKLAKVTGLVFDKTGTITKGKMQVTDVVGKESRVIALAANGEAYSSHPIAKAVLQYAQDTGITVRKPETFTNLRGKGITYEDVAVGNAALMDERGVMIPEELARQAEALQEQGKTVLMVEQSGALAGLIAVSDAVRDNSSGVVEQLKELGLHDVVMATGDNRRYADLVGWQVGLTQVYADCLPEDKVELVSKLQKDGGTVAMVGDGVNDAPALAKADVGIAMGAMGSDVAIETADIALMGDDIGNIPLAIKLSQKTSHTIAFNVIASVALNLGAVVLASFGHLTPVWGALVHNLGAIVVVLNSTWLFSKKVK